MKRGKILLGIGVLFGLAQLVGIERTNPPVQSDIAAPPPVKAVLQRACYDCHSNESVWPWYSQVAPFSWLLARDVREGRRELNFSTWNAYEPKRRAKKLKETIEEVRDGDMPPWYYVVMHPDAKLADADRAAIEQWAGAAPAGAPVGAHAE